MQRLGNIFCTIVFILNRNSGEKAKLIHFKTGGLHVMWLTQTNLENKDSFQRKHKKVHIN